MADFKPTSPPPLVYDSRGMFHAVLGWWSDDDWSTFEPVVGHPEGSGAGPWRRFHGEDPWYVKD